MHRVDDRFERQVVAANTDSATDDDTVISGGAQLALDSRAGGCRRILKTYEAGIDLPAPARGGTSRSAAGNPVTPVGLEQPATGSDFRTVPGFVGGRRLLSGNRAAPLASFLFSGRVTPRLVEPVLQYVLGVVRTPAVRQQWLEVRLSRAHVQQHIPEIGPRLQAMTLRARQDREQHRRSRARISTPQELPIFASNSLEPQRPLRDIVVDG